MTRRIVPWLVVAAAILAILAAAWWWDTTRTTNPTRTPQPAAQTPEGDTR